MYNIQGIWNNVKERFTNESTTDAPNVLISSEPMTEIQKKLKKKYGKCYKFWDILINDGGFKPGAGIAAQTQKELDKSMDPVNHIRDNKIVSEKVGKIDNDLKKSCKEMMNGEEAFIEFFLTSLDEKKKPLEK